MCFRLRIDAPYCREEVEEDQDGRREGRREKGEEEKEDGEKEDGEKEDEEKEGEIHSGYFLTQSA